MTVLRSLVPVAPQPNSYLGRLIVEVSRSHTIRHTHAQCGPKTDEVTEDWRRLHNEKLYALYSSLNIIRVIKSRMRWAAHVERKGATERYIRGFYGEA